MKLRLLLSEECNRNCVGCCNKDWDLKNLPTENDFSEYDIIMLTGGEPMLNPGLIMKTVERIRKVNDCPIYLYTAKVNNILDTITVLDAVDGITLTLHENKDIVDFYSLNHILEYYQHFVNPNTKSLRLNVFDKVKINRENYPMWEVKENIKWIKNCPLPGDEVFKRLEEK